jgi:hypothetical protein
MPPKTYVLPSCYFTANNSMIFLIFYLHNICDLTANYSWKPKKMQHLCRRQFQMVGSVGIDLRAKIPAPGFTREMFANGPGPRSLC